MDALVELDVACEELALKRIAFIVPSPPPQIASECSAALNYIVDLHTKQRKEVWARHAAERSKLRRSVFKHCAKHGASGAVTAAEPHPRPPSPGSRAIFVGAETQALREASANWLRAERFSLLTAFRQQVQRVQTEWSDHVQQLRDVRPYLRVLTAPRSRREGRRGRGPRRTLGFRFLSGRIVRQPSASGRSEPRVTGLVLPMPVGFHDLPGACAGSSS